MSLRDHLDEAVTARAERDVARADLADLQRRVGTKADNMAAVEDDEDVECLTEWDKGWDAACRAHSIDLRDLIPCPTCNGTAWVPKPGTQGHNLPAAPCPDCTKETE